MTWALQGVVPRQAGPAAGGVVRCSRAASRPRHGATTGCAVRGVEVPR